MNQFSGFWLVLYYILVVGTWLATIIFSVGYGVLMRWRQTESGQHLFYYSLAITAAMTLVVLRPVFGDFPGRPIASMFCLVFLFAVVWWRVVLWVRTYNQNRPHKKALGMTENGGDVRGREE